MGITGKDGGLAALTSGERRLIALESLQWCAVNAVYFLGLIGAATYELGGDAFLVAAITLARNLCNSLANAAAGPVIDRVGPRKTALVTLVSMLAMSVFMGIVPPSVPTLMFFRRGEVLWRESGRVGYDHLVNVLRELEKREQVAQR